MSLSESSPDPLPGRSHSPKSGVLSASYLTPSIVLVAQYRWIVSLRSVVQKAALHIPPTQNIDCPSRGAAKDCRERLADGGGKTMLQRQ